MKNFLRSISILLVIIAITAITCFAQSSGSSSKSSDRNQGKVLDRVKSERGKLKNALKDYLRAKQWVDAIAVYPQEDGEIIYRDMDGRTSQTPPLLLDSELDEEFKGLLTEALDYEEARIKIAAINKLGEFQKKKELADRELEAARKAAGLPAAIFPLPQAQPSAAAPQLSATPQQPPPLNRGPRSPR